jgi:ABC-type branched-subunit amino acid transport system substrate-binding protein/DNA-binding beta-propeller fold protein YncE
VNVVVGPGSRFAGYQIESLIGRGGMGVVYRATDLRLDRPVALKLIAPELAHDERFRRRFLEEPRLAASLDHSSVIPIYEAGDSDGQLYLAMRYVQGSDLRAVLERERTLAPERALHILGQIAGALDAAHRRGLVHGDVKPANVLLDEDEHAYLTDFGVSKLVGGTSLDTGQATGTLDYLAPEQIRGEPVDGRTDGYALACVLYECVTGRAPFRRQTPAETLWAHLQEEPPPLDGHPALDQVLRRALAQDNEERYASCAGVIGAARAALGVAAPGTPMLPALVRRRRAVLAAGLLAVAATIAGTVLALTGKEEAPRAPRGNGVAAVDPAGDRVAAFVPAATAPSNIAVGDGAVWFLNSENQTVSRIDPKTKGVTATIRSRGVPTDLAVGEGALWLGTGGGVGANWTVAVSRIDPVTRATTHTATLPEDARGGVFPYLNWGFPQIAVGAGAVWATGGGALSRIDPRTGRLVATVDVDASRIAAGEEGVWFLSGFDPQVVTRIDPRTNRVAQRIRIRDAGLSGLAVGAGAVWATAEHEGVVWRIEPGRKPRTTPIAVSAGVTYIAYGGGAIWAANDLEGTVARIDPDTNGVSAELPVGAVQALAVGAGSAWVSTAGATRAGTLPASACGELMSRVSEPDVLLASDLPLQGPGGHDPPPPAMVKAIRFVLGQHGFRAGRYTVGYRSCDDSTKQTGFFEPRRCAANANAYAYAERLVAVIGPHNSGCAQVELPILNRAPGGPLAMISPTNSAVGLTRGRLPPPFGYRGEPEVFYPIGARHYVRLTAPESLEGVAHAVLAKRLGLKRVYVLYDGGAYWKAVLADPFRRAAPRLGVGIAGSETFDPDAKSYAALTDRVARSGAQGVVLGAGPFDGGVRLLKALRARLGKRVAIMAGAEFGSIPTAELFDQVGAGARGLYVATVDVPRSALPLSPAGQRFARAVRAKQLGVLEAAQATELVLSAIARSDGTRASVLQRLRASEVRDGILGSFHFDRQGDMTPGWMTILRITRPVPEGEGFASGLHGAVVDSVVKVPPSLAD